MAGRTPLKLRLQNAYQLLRTDFFTYRYGIAAAIAILLFLQIVFGATCPFRILFGLPCPGCGLTRASILALKGEWTASISMHPMAIGALLLMISFPFVRYFFAKLFTFWKICGIIWLVSTLIVFGYRMLTQFPGDEPICFYEGILQQWFAALLGA